MSERKFEWDLGNDKTHRLYAQLEAGIGRASFLDPNLYGLVYSSESLRGRYKVEYWLVQQREGRSLREATRFMDGTWMEVCTCSTLEEAKAVAENAVRLNLGGWP